MPSSFASSFPPIVEALIAADPRTVVDIGPGWGKYGLACREYLPNLKHLVAVEVTQGRLPIQDQIYDLVIEADALELPADTWKRFDVALMVDVIEHMTVRDGSRLVADLREKECRVIVATPQLWIEQHDDTNPYETHRSLWCWDYFARFGPIEDRSTEDAIIYTLG